MASATDSFTRGDNTVLGASWTNRKGGDTAFGISTNRASINVNLDSASWWNADTFNIDQYAEAALSGLSGTNVDTGLGVCVRCDTSHIGDTAYYTYYEAVVNTAASNNVIVSKWIANTYTFLAYRTQAWSDGDILRLEVSGTDASTALRVYRNGVQLGANITDPGTGGGYITVGQPGLAHIASFATGFADNWGGGDLDQVLLPDQDLATSGWTIVGGGTAFSKLNDSLDATYVSATAG